MSFILRFMTAGESHGPGLTAIIEGIPAGLVLSEEIINVELARRQLGYGAGPRMKLESDRCVIHGGVMAGKTIGAPISLWIENKNHDRWVGQEIEPFSAPRPGHVDLNAAVKYRYDDLRPGLERASARETAARVAVGAICKELLRQFGIGVSGYVISIGDVMADVEDIPVEMRGNLAEVNEVRCPSETAAEKMRLKIRETMENRDTIGGVIEVAAWGLPTGLGSHVQWDRKLDARLAAAMMSVQAMKGVEIGPAFENSRLPGTQVQDGIILKEGLLTRAGNRAGGIEGGISTGMPIIVRAAMKPIATTLKPQKTVDLVRSQETDTVYERSDFCPAPRAAVVLENTVAFVLADALLEKLGGDSMEEIQERFKKLRNLEIEGLKMTGEGRVFWK